MRNGVLCAILIGLALPAAASDLARGPTYGISLSWDLGARDPSPRFALSVNGYRVPLHEEKSADPEGKSLSCPPEGCSRGFLLAVGVVYALGTWALIRTLDKD